MTAVSSALAASGANRPNIVLDATDHEIVRLLSAQGRLPNNALAEAVGIAPSTCL